MSSDVSRDERIDRARRHLADMIEQRDRAEHDLRQAQDARSAAQDRYVEAMQAYESALNAPR